MGLRIKVEVILSISFEKKLFAMAFNSNTIIYFVSFVNEQFGLDT